MIKEVSKDIVPFMIILILSMASYMHIMATLTFYEKELEEGIYSMLFQESYVLSLGELPSYDTISMKFVIFLIYSLLIPIVLMNLLIAILSDAYERVQSQAKSADIKVLASLIQEVEIMLRCLRKYRKRDG